jgi:cytochrome c-type biogenesis protein CcmH
VSVSVLRRVASYVRRSRLIRDSLLASAILALATTGPALAQEPQTTLPDVEDEVMCPVCGTTLELASDAQQAIRQREFIRDLIAQGQTKEQIKDALVAEFGDEVLALPDDEGFDLAAWVVPGIAIIAAAIAIFIALRRWRSASREAEPAPAPEPLDAEDAGRLEADLERYGR